MKKIRFLTGTTMLEMIELWAEDKYTIECGLFLQYPAENGKYIACDNLTQDCWVEEFDTLPEAMDWLLGL